MKHYKSILIKSSFRKPLFNKEMEKELLKAANWLLYTPLPNDTIIYMSRLIHEIVTINGIFLKKHSFEELTDKYNCYREFGIINPDIKYSAICYVCDKAVMTNNNLDQLTRCIRQFSNLICSENMSDNDCHKCLFLHRFCCSIFF